MKWISWSLIGLLFFTMKISPAWASRTTYQLANPFGWMHLMPTGETPGWSEDTWINFELSQSNLWNSETTRMTNLRNGESISFIADFEQTSAILEMGHAWGNRIATSIVIPYAHRGGGFLDNFIDDFHVMTGSHRFARQFFDEGQSTYRITNGNETRLDVGPGGDVGNLKFKIKYWMWKWQTSVAGACDCGLSFGFQTKAPIGTKNKGFTSEEWDYTGTVHLGIPLWKDSGFFATSAFTHISNSDITRNWPMRRWHQMYEATLDMGIGAGWGLVLTGRMESPWLEKGEVRFESTSSNRDHMIAERAASGWNGLVHWRGSQSLGVRYRAGPKFDIGLHVVEDFALGNFDESGDDLYSNNAPDVAFVLKIGSSF